MWHWTIRKGDGVGRQLAIIFHTRESRYVKLWMQTASPIITDMRRKSELARCWLKKLHYDNRTTTRFTLHCYHDYNLTEKALRRYLSKFDNQLEDALLVLDVQLADSSQKPGAGQQTVSGSSGNKRAAATAMHAEEEPQLPQTLAVNGRDMMDFGLCGKQIGTALHMLLDYAMGSFHQHKKQLIWELNRKCQNLHMHKPYEHGLLSAYAYFQYAGLSFPLKASPSKPPFSSLMVSLPVLIH